MEREEKRRGERRGRKVDALNAIEAKFKERSKLDWKARERRWRLNASLPWGAVGRQSEQTNKKAWGRGEAGKSQKGAGAAATVGLGLGLGLGLLAMVGLLALMLLAGMVRPAAAQVSPQFGFEYYGGSNKLRTLTPWGGVRFSLSSNASFIVRYSYRDMRYDYWGSDGGGGSVLKTKDASLNQFSGTVYFSEKNLTGYVSGAWLTGSEGYKGYVGETGVDWKFHRSLSAIWSIYSIREKSILWHPEENERWINTYSMRIGLRFWLTKDLSFNPNIYLMKNSEGVDSRSFSVGLIYSPKWWMAVTAYYFHYGEMAFYVFHGNYASLGLNFYF